MASFQCYGLFCEDIRWESNGSPMVIGIMSPVIHPASYPAKFSHINFLSFIRADMDVNILQADLKIEKDVSGSLEFVGEYSSEFHQDESDVEGRQWVALAALPIRDIEFNQGDTIIATLKINDVESVSYLTAGSEIEDQPV